MTGLHSTIGLLVLSRGILVGSWFSTAASFPLVHWYIFHLHFLLMKCCGSSSTMRMRRFLSS